MIDVKELRIGNGCIWSRNASIYGGKECTVSLSNIKYSGLMNPIPLTKELLIKVGGMLQPADLDDTVAIRLQIGKFGFWADSSNDFKTLECENMPKIESLHQLQNFYFAHALKELKGVNNG